MGRQISGSRWARPSPHPSPAGRGGSQATLSCPERVENLASAKGAIKILCEVADPG